MNSENSNRTLHLGKWREEIQREETKTGGLRTVRRIRGL